jgi:hypothetical protein
MRLQNSSNKGDASGLIVLIILVCVVGAGLGYLYSHKKQAQNEGRAFARQVVEHLALQHDVGFFAANLSGQARAEYPQSQQLLIITNLTQLGAPAQPIKIDGDIQFESGFFEPRGIFRATLNCPGRQGFIDLAISRTTGQWEIDNVTVSGGR